MFSLICVWINGWVNNGEACDLRRYRAHYDTTVMFCAGFNHFGAAGLLWENQENDDNVIKWKQALCKGKPRVTGGFPSQRPVMQSFDVFLIHAWTNGWVNNRDTVRDQSRCAPSQLDSSDVSHWLGISLAGRIPRLIPAPLRYHCFHYDITVMYCGCWCLGSLCHQDIGSHGNNSRITRSFSTTCAILITTNDKLFLIYSYTFTIFFLSF